VAEISSSVRAALNKLYASDPAAKTLGQKAKGILVFPSIVKAGFIVGGQGGDDAMFKRRWRVHKRQRRTASQKNGAVWGRSGNRLDPPLASEFSSLARGARCSPCSRCSLCLLVWRLELLMLPARRILLGARRIGERCLLAVDGSDHDQIEPVN
jgi:hypothetical protein